MPDGSRLMGESEVDVPPRLISPGPRNYPAEAREMGKDGRVTVTYVIDTEGRAVKASLRIVQANDQVFVPSVIELIQASRFSPGVQLGSAVAVCVRQEVNFVRQ
jgi:TonB family protein